MAMLAEAVVETGPAPPAHHGVHVDNDSVSLGDACGSRRPGLASLSSAQGGPPSMDTYGASRGVATITLDGLGTASSGNIAIASGN